ncbi:DUF4350 domain-containing protein [Arthrobacter sp. NyZ413]|uniref:DUF4350 domain-containing protein n=1 Tax=Arthrobacter sp. NyZ413 TaxID=3144669 RepID=UPI003BF7D0E5
MTMAPVSAGDRKTGRDTPPPTEPRGPGRNLREWARRRSSWLLIGALIVVLAVVTVAENSGGSDTAPLSARNPAPNGAMAVAEILRQHGVTVTQSDSFANTTALLSGKPQATVLLYDPNGFLGASQLHRLEGTAGRLVVVAPGFRTLSGLGAGIRNAGVVPTSTTTVEPGCRQADAVAAGTVSGTGGFLYAGAETTCYRPGNGDGGMYAASADGRLVVFGSTELLSNQLLQNEGNAALSLRTLGSAPELIWYLPGIGDVPKDGRAPTLNDLAPPWVGFLGLWLAIVAVLAVLWRGRRLGPLVFEPLPVVVKAAETAEGRARLYQDSRAVARAADNLRAGTLARLAKHFRLGPEASAEAVLDAMARRLDRAPQELRPVVLDHKPHSESELVRWAQSIERIEQEAIAR